MELEQAERERPHLSGCWREFIDALLDDVHLRLQPEHRLGKDPCLVIPIDDADMNPELCSELLELVRALWHPRVAFILTGDSELFQERLTVRFREAELSADRANRLAFEAYDKAIPTPHRFVIRAEPVTGLRFLGDRLDKRVRSWLTNFPELRAALPTSWRSLQNLKLQLEAGGHKSTDDLITWLFHQAVEAEQELAPDEKRRIKEQVVGGEGSRDGIIVFEGLCKLVPRTADLQLKLPDSLEIAISRTYAAPLVLRRVPGGDKASTKDSDNTVVSDRIRAAYYLASARASESGFRLSHDLTPQEYPFAKVRILVGEQAFPLLWPVPIWDDAADFLWFRRYFEALLLAYGGQIRSVATDLATDAQRAEIGNMAARFVGALLALAEKSDDDYPDPKLFLPPTPVPTWESLGSRIATLGRKAVYRNGREREYVEWARTGGPQFLYPETGLSGNEQDSLLRGWLPALGLLDKDDGPKSYMNRVGAAEGMRHARFRWAIERTGVPSETLFQLFLRQRSAMDEMLAKIKLHDGSNRKEPSHEEAERIQFEKAEPKVNYFIERLERRVLDTAFSRANLGSFESHCSWHLRYFLSQWKIKHRKGSSCQRPANLFEYLRNLDSISMDFHRSLIDHTDGISLLRKLRDAEPKADVLDGFQIVHLHFLEHMTRRSSASSASSAPDLRDSVRPLISHHLRVDEQAVMQTPAAPIKKPGQDAKNIAVWYRDGEQIKWIFPDFDDLVVTKTSGERQLLLILQTILVDCADLDLSVTKNDLLLFSYVLFSSYNLDTTLVEFGLPEPGWLSWDDRRLVYANYGNSVRFLGEQTEGANQLTFYLRILCGILNWALERSFRQVFDDIRLLELRRSDNSEKIQKALLEIAKELLSDIGKAKFRGRRWAAVMEWVRYGIPLFAAPESGLSKDDAGKWLNFFDYNSHELTAEDCLKLRQIRRRRAAQALDRAALQTPGQRDADDLLQELDGLDPDHPWLRRFEMRARDQKPAAKSSPPKTVRKARGPKQPAKAKGTPSRRRTGSKKPKKGT